ncbi:MAG: HAD family phosphatase [Clostridia bacterium]|nr:HAD family phosphatase [Clostridia bacterium]
MIKLLAVDMDGTCLNSKGDMTDNTLNALKKAAESGVIVVPTTGRNITCLPRKIQNESFYRYVISSNGALAVDKEEDCELFKSYIENDIAVEIVKKCRKHLILIAAHIDRDYYVQGRLLYLGVKHFLGKDSSRIIRVKSMAETLKDKTRHLEEFQFFYHGEKYRDIIKKIIAPFPEVCSAHSRGYAEIYNENGTKGKAVLSLARHLGISQDEIACVGDGENDISMFEIAGHSFAMGNAVEHLKSIADVVLPTNDEDGVAAAIEEYILKTEIQEK